MEQALPAVCSAVASHSCSFQGPLAAQLRLDDSWQLVLVMLLPMLLFTPLVC
jgi:hypothetical protein